MAFQRGIYGIAYDEQQRSPLRRLWLWPLLALAVILALFFVRGCGGKEPEGSTGDGEPGQTRYHVPAVETARERPSIWRHFITYRRTGGVAPASAAKESAADGAQGGRWLDAEAKAPLLAAEQARSPEVRRLLERIAECEGRDDLTGVRKLLYQLLLRPDIEDTRALFERKLGMVNVTLVLGDYPMLEKSRHVIVAGDLISKLARRYGCTQAYLLKANRIERPDRMQVGEELWALDNPQFELVVSHGATSAVLTLNGRFFKRYEFRGAAIAPDTAPGRYTVAAVLTQLDLRPADVEELRLLLPQSAVVTVQQ